MIIGLLSAAAVLVVAAIVAAMVHAGGSGSPRNRTPGEAVQGYLEALARGDAKAALSFSADQPASTDFLTDEILGQQIAKWPITDTRILSEDTFTPDMGMVHVVANFGDNTSDQTVDVVKSGDGWKIKRGTMRLKLEWRGREKAMSTVTLFGRPLDQSREAYDLFPGWVDIATANEFITMKPLQHPLLLSEILTPGVDSYEQLNFDINDQGRAAAVEAAKAVIAECVKSTELAPPNCPQATPQGGLAAGTAQWSLPDLSGLTAKWFEADTMTVQVEGLPMFPLTAKTTSGESVSRKALPYFATADLMTTPPKLTFGV